MYQQERKHAVYVCRNINLYPVSKLNVWFKNWQLERFASPTSTESCLASGYSRSQGSYMENSWQIMGNILANNCCLWFRLFQFFVWNWLWRYIRNYRDAQLYKTNPKTTPFTHQGDCDRDDDDHVYILAVTDEELFTMEKLFLHPCGRLKWLKPHANSASNVWHFPACACIATTKGSRKTDDSMMVTFLCGGIYQRKPTLNFEVTGIAENDQFAILEQIESIFVFLNPYYGFQNAENALQFGFPISDSFSTAIFYALNLKFDF